MHDYNPRFDYPAFCERMKQPMNIQQLVKDEVTKLVSDAENSTLAESIKTYLDGELDKLEATLKSYIDAELSKVSGSGATSNNAPVQ